MKRVEFDLGQLRPIKVQPGDTFEVVMWKAMHNSGGGRLLFREAIQAHPDELPEQPRRRRRSPP